MQEELDRPTNLQMPDAAEQPDDGGPSAKVIVGPDDDRLRIKDTRQFPWRCHCSLAIRYTDGRSDEGTGFLIGRRTVLTAGHCVFSHAHGGAAAAIRVTPGRDGDTEPFGSVGAIGFDSVDGWTQTQHPNPAFDYGVLFLPPDFIPPAFGALSCEALPDASLSGLEAVIAGYPVEKRGALCWNGGPINQVAPRFLGYPIDTTPGQSGAPVWTARNRQARVVGIHIKGIEGGNLGVRINNSVLATIRTWLQRGEV